MWVQVGARGGPIMRQDPHLPLCFSVGVVLRWYLRWFWRSDHLMLVNLRFQYLELSTHIQEGLPQNLTFICLFVCLFVIVHTGKNIRRFLFGQIVGLTICGENILSLISIQSRTYFRLCTNMLSLRQMRRPLSEASTTNKRDHISEQNRE